SSWSIWPPGVVLEGAEDAPWIVDEHGGDLLIADTMTFQPTGEMGHDIGIAEAAIVSEHHLDEDVLRQEDPVEKAQIDQPLDGARIVFIRRALHLLIGIPVVHADHVIFDESAAFGAGSLVIDVFARRINMA